jgi:type I restriction enzyme S subunit
MITDKTIIKGLPDETSVKAGYKQTDIGVIPSDWDVKKIKEFTLITTGSKNTQDRIFDGSYPFFVRSQTVERINSYSYDGEAVLTAGDGVGTGKVFHYINGKFDFHQRVYKISDFNEKLDGYFFYLYFSNNFYNRIMQMTAKSSVDSVRMEMIAEMLIPIPSKKEQTAIATVLSDTGTLIESLEKLIAKKKAIKQGALQQLLTGKKRLPGFSGEWEVKRLDEIFSITAGRDLIKESHSQIRDDDHPFPIYSNSLENRGLYGYTGIARHKENSITITARGTIGRANDRDHKFDAIGRLLVLEPKKELNCFFISEYLNNKVVFSIESTGVPQLTSPQASKYLIIYPNPVEQTTIATILSDMDAEIESLEQKRDKYTMLKQGMMQQLLTGRIRIYANN